MRKALVFSWLSLAVLIATAGAQQTTIVPQVRTKPTADNKITSIELAAHFVTAIRVPEAVNSVVVGDPALFQVEHSEHEPELVFVKALTKTSSGSCSECSTWNSAGSPTTTEFTASGTRIAVTKCAASSIEVILLSAVGLVRTCGTMVVCCAPAVAISTASESQLKTKAFLICH